MRKKTSLTIVEHAMVLVPEFKSRAVKLEHQVVLRGQSASTLNNYLKLNLIIYPSKHCQADAILTEIIAI